MSNPTFFLNGQPQSMGEETSLMDLVAAHQLEPRSVLIEHNGEAVPRRIWSERLVKAGDRVEFLRVVAGG